MLLIPTIGMEIIVAPRNVFIGCGILIGFATNLGHGSGGFSNLIMTIHVNKTTN
jgi:hypothetical protein